jgi:Na+-transporting NADH:ubiquinone oxidoreductase subunit NqrD
MGYTCVLLIMSVFRELFGTGKIVLFNRTILSLGTDSPPSILIYFPGAFITFALLLAALQWYQERRKRGEG